MPYISDFTKILDEHDGVYLDFYHVTEKGNEVIADKMFKFIVNFL